jgi:flagellar motor switch protein FliN
MSQLSSHRANLQHLLDVGFKIRAEYGTARLQLAEILDLQQRGLVELSRAPDGFVDLYIDDQRIARGEVLAMNNRYAVRITEIIETRREHPQFSTPLRSNVTRKEETERSRIEDLISLDNYHDDDEASAHVHENSIADAYEFPSLDDMAVRRDDPTTGPNDPTSGTYSPRRSVPKPPGA